MFFFRSLSQEVLRTRCVQGHPCFKTIQTIQKTSINPLIFKVLCFHPLKEALFLPTMICANLGLDDDWRSFHLGSNIQTVPQNV